MNNQILTGTTESLGFQKSELKIKKAKIDRFLIGCLISLTVLVLGSGVALAGFQKKYQETSLPNLFLADLNVSQLDKNTLAKEIEKLSQEFSQSKNILSLTNQYLIAENQDLGFKVDQKATLDQVWNLSRNSSIFEFGQELLADAIEPKKFDLILELDEKKFADFNQNVLNDLIKSPIDAQISLENNQITIRPEESGLAINLEDFKTKVKHQIGKNQINDLSLISHEIKPEISAANLESLKSQLDQLMAKPLILKAGAKSLQLKGTELFTFLNFSKNENQLQAEVNDQALESYLAKNEKSLVIKKIDEQIAQDSGLVIRAGKNGQKIDRTQAANALKELVNQKIAGQNQTENFVILTIIEEPFEQKVIDPSQLVAASALDAAAKTGKSLVVDISEQRLTAFENGQVTNTFLISSGMPGYETPRGSYTLGTRVYSKWYRGYNRDGSYWSYPNTLYNLNITGPFWLHGAYWHNDFGRKKSHGCVNVAYANASWLWDWTQTGTPITIQD